MYGIEKKLEIEMKLKKEMNNIQELKAVAKRSSTLAGDVCNVLGACEQRLQQLEVAVSPLYGDTGRLQRIHNNMQRTVSALDQVISYYMVTRELADLIQAGPHTSSTESLKIYLDALNKLTEAQEYFNKNNPQSVELENINQLYNNGVMKLESSFEDLLARNTRPISPTTLMDMIALEEDSSVESVSVSGGGGASGGLSGGVSGGGSGGGMGAGSMEVVRAAAGWLDDAGRAPDLVVVAARAAAARASLAALIEHLQSGALASPLARAKNVLHRSDSAKKTSKIQKVLEKRANKIMMRASQTLEQSTGLAIGSRRSMSDSYSEECSEVVDEREAEVAGAAAVALVRLARLEQQQLVGLVKFARLPATLLAVLNDCLQMLATLTQKAVARTRRSAARCGGGAAAGWALLSRLRRLARDVDRALHPASPAPYTALLNACQHACIKSLEDWIEGVSGDKSSGSVDGTVHQLAAATLHFCHALADNSRISSVGAALSTEPNYIRCVSQLVHVQDKDAAYLSVFMRKVLAQLNLALRNKSEQYPDALKAIFLLNNTLYILQGLQRSGLIEVLMISEPDCEMSYRNMIHDYNNHYLQSWNKLLSNLTMDEPLPAKLRDKDRQLLKDKFASFNREWEECTRSQRSYSVPDPELRESLKRDNKQAILPPYTAFYDAYAGLPFSKNPDKYVKYTPVQISAQLDGYFDETA